jgi:hypothetical protein
MAVQIRSEAIDRLDIAANETQLSRARIVEHLIARHTDEELLQLLREEAPNPSRLGRPKQSIHKKAS